MGGAWHGARGWKLGETREKRKESTGPLTADQFRNSLFSNQPINKSQHNTVRTKLESIMHIYAEFSFCFNYFCLRYRSSKIAESAEKVLLRKGLLLFFQRPHACTKRVCMRVCKAE